MLLGLREGLRRHPRSATERYSRKPDAAVTERRQGHAIKKSDWLAPIGFYIINVEVASFLANDYK